MNKLLNTEYIADATNNSGNNTETALVDMIGGMLDANHNAVEGQQYLVSYAYCDGSNRVANIRIIKEDGAWKEVVQ